MPQQGPYPAPWAPVGVLHAPIPKNTMGDPTRFWRVLAMLRRNMSHCLYEHLAIYLSERHSPT